MKSSKSKAVIVLSASRQLSEDAWGAFQLMPAADLVKLANGTVSARKVAQEEMASRGLGLDGEWVGFEKAGKLWGVK